MEFLKFFIIAVITFVIGFGLPVVIYLMMRGGAGMRELDVFVKAIHAPRAHSSQNKDIDELSRRVAELKAARPVVGADDEGEA